MNHVTVLAWLLAAVCGGAGVFNLGGSPKVRETFEQYGYPRGWHIVTGVLEIVGAILTVLPMTRRVGAALLGAVMIAAFVTVVRHKVPRAIIASIILTAIAAYLTFRP